MEASSELVECGHKSWLAGSMKKKTQKTAVYNCGKYIYWKQYISSDSPIKCTMRVNDSEPVLEIFKLESLCFSHSY